MKIRSKGSFIYAKGKREEIEKKQLELLKKGYQVFVELYDRNIYCLAATTEY